MPTHSAVGVVIDGRYRISEPLAEGGMGSVYLGEQDNLHREVAIKMIRQPDPDDALRFQREAEALAAVSHPAIVDVYDYLQEATVSYLVMAYVKGDNLADHAASRPDGVLTPLEALELMLPVASALVELHTHGILHRDLKPANLVRYMRADGRPAVKLVDFGIVRRQQDAALTADGLIVGTPPYLSPEVVLGKGHSEGSDVYALGATLFELLTGEPPHGCDELHQVLTRIVREEVQLPPTLAGTELGALLMRLLARAPDDRPAMQEVLEALERIRLSLVQRTGDVAAVVQATRAMAQTPDGPTQALRSDRDAATVTMPTKAPQGQRPTQAPPLLPWILAGIAIVAATAVSIYFTVREPRTAKPPAQGHSAAQGPPRTAPKVAPMAKRATPAPRRAAPPPRRRVAEAPEVAPQALARELARCTDANAAYTMFRKSTFSYRLKKRLPWVKVVFAALLKCRHASASNRRWVAYRLALLHTRAGACTHATRRWKQYQSLARLTGSRPVRRPPCAPKP